MKKFLLFCAVVCTSLWSSAQLNQIVVEQIDVDAFGGWVNGSTGAVVEGAMPGAITYRVFAELQDANDQVPTVFATGCHSLQLSTTTSFYNNAAGGSAIPNAGVLPFVPGLEADSYIAIGEGSGASFAPTATFDAVFGAAASSNSLVLNDLVGGAWLDLGGGVTGTGPNNRVLLGQFTTDGDLSFQFNVKVRDGDTGDIFDYVHDLACNLPAGVPTGFEVLSTEVVFPAPVAVNGCTDGDALNFDPAATADDGSCILPDCDLADDETPIAPTSSETACYDSGVTLTRTYVADNAGDQVILAFNAGTVEVGFDEFFVYDGTSNADPLIAGPIDGSLAGQIYESTSGALTFEIVADGSVSCGSGAEDQAEYDVYCGSLAIFGCTTNGACNFDPLATDDDGSCFFPPSEDDCANAIDLGSASTSVSGSNENACVDTETGETSGVFYSFTLNNPAEVVITTSENGGLDDSQLAIFDGCGGTELFFNDDIGFPNFMSEISLACGDLAPGTYILMVDGFNGAQGTFDLSLTIDEVACSVIDGCTDEDAINYDPAANNDDGSCIIADCDVDDNVAPAPSASDSYCYVNNDNTVYTYVADNAGDQVIIEFTAGIIEAGFDTITVYDGLSDADPVIGVFDGSMAGVVVESTGGALTFVIESDGSASCTTPAFGLVSETTEWNVYCGSESTDVFGCTDNTACNFDPLATVNTGCIFPPSEDDCANAIDLGSASTSVSGSNENACVDTEFDEESGVFYSFTLNNPAEVVITTSENGGLTDSQLAIFDGCGGTELFFNDDIGFPNFMSEISLSCGDLAPGTYILMVDGFNGAQGTFDLSLTIDEAACALGCTDGDAINFDPGASSDDGSCILVDCDVDDEVAPSPTVSESYCYSNDDDTFFVYAADNAGDEVTVEFTTGLTELNFDDIVIYDGQGTGGAVITTLNGDVSGTVVESTTGSITVQFVADGSVSCAGFGSPTTVEWNVYCGSEVPTGCTDITACNYDAGAVLDDGSCIPGPCFNDLPSLATSLPLDPLGSCTGLVGEDLTNATVTGPGAAPGSGNDLWYSVVPSTSGLRVEVATGDFDAVVEILDASETSVDIEDVAFSGTGEILNIGNLTAGDLYYIRVRSFFSSPAAGEFDICVQSIPDTRCDYGPGPYSLCDTYKADWIPGAADYIFTFTADSDGTEYTYQAGGPNTFVGLTDAGLPWDDTYTVAINVVFELSRSNGTTELIEVENDEPCSMIVDPVPATQLSPVDNVTNAGPRFLNEVIRATPWVCGTIDWEWRFVNQDGVQLAITHFRGSSNRFMRLNNVAGLQEGATYDVQVRPIFASGAGAFGPVEELAIIGAAGMDTASDSPVVVVDGQEERLDIEDAAAAMIYPNPNNGEMMFVNVNDVPANVDRVLVDIYDLAGKRIVSEQLATTGSANFNVQLPLSNLNSGMYIVNIVVGDEVYTERLTVAK